MPNHVKNALTIFGDAHDVATFVVRSQTPRPRTGDTSYGGEGPCFGRMIYHRGIKREALEGNFQALPAYNDEDDQYDQRYDEAVSQYLLTHDAWVAELIATVK